MILTDKINLRSLTMLLKIPTHKAWRWYIIRWQEQLFLPTISCFLKCIHTHSTRVHLAATGWGKTNTKNGAWKGVDWGWLVSNYSKWNSKSPQDACLNQMSSICWFIAVCNPVPQHTLYERNVKRARNCFYGTRLYYLMGGWGGGGISIFDTKLCCHFECKHFDRNQA